MDWLASLLGIGPGPMTAFLWVALALAATMLIWDTIEVGRNDAANLVNAVYGARIVSVRQAVWLAGTGAVLGATFASPVVETARKGIFDPAQLLTIQDALAVYLSVYIVDTILLYGYSSFGMPVSTTATLVFSLLGGSLALGGFDIVHWNKAGNVILAIICSIFISAMAGFLIQRAVRGAILHRGQKLPTLLLHGGWVGGGMLAGLTYFMLVKGMKSLPFVRWLNETLIDAYGPALVVMVLWGIFAIGIHGCLILFRQRAAKWLFPVLAMIGTVCMAFAFGQNDLANCASPGLAAYQLIANREHGVAAATAVPISRWMLFASGMFLVLGMATSSAQRVTKAAASAGSMSHNVALWAPRWCLALAGWFLRFRGTGPTLAPPPVQPDTGEARDYDALRACVILGVSASVIATASSFGLPVSTTYVAFAAIVATGAADRILQRGDAELKLARTIWVVFSWFAAAGIAAVAAAVVCRLIATFELWGIALGLGGNLAVRFVLEKRGALHEARVAEEARERMFPEEYADYEG